MTAAAAALPQNARVDASTTKVDGIFYNHTLLFLVTLSSYGGALKKGKMCDNRKLCDNP